MELEERLAALEEEFNQTKEEIQQILLDIRAFLMESQSPLPVTTSFEGAPESGTETRG